MLRIWAARPPEASPAMPSPAFHGAGFSRHTITLVVTRDHVFDVLRTIPDPEMPVSIVDLGLVQRIEVSRNGGEGASEVASHVQIDLLPTFIGCPALEMIAGDVRAKVSKLDGVKSVLVNWSFDPPWSVERITAEGRASLREHGVTVPEHGSKLDVPSHMAPTSVRVRISAVSCPFCGSKSTYLDSPFGPTRCRMIFYCEACRNSFEHLKKV
ncbi:MAG: phenylacetate-CoA oxygenase subunit PaaJ [Phycisphaerales bacterium]|nr:phenylacetate-CoA oxygenase subunit PaaJ [Phycisphaerales bacterium]MCI0674435.1 phenylacetate-CoA oxygenase subunit PaaJ [Phycisphaerales bacterium]